MPFTDEMRQRAAEVRRQNREAREAAASSTAVAERPTIEEDAEPDSENVMAKLASLFSQAATEKKGRDRAINEALDVLGKLDPIKYPEIADNDQVQAFIEKVQQQRAQSSDVPPGTIMGSGLAAYKKPWTVGDLLKGRGMPAQEAIANGFIEWVMYRPMKNFDVTWQGIRILWPARREGYFPKSHVDQFEQSLDAEEFAEQHAAWLFNHPEAQAHADFFTTNAPRVKAMDHSKGEYHHPGAGLIDLTPSPDLVALSGGSIPAEET